MGLQRQVEQTDPRPWRLILVLVLAAAAGLVGIPLQVLTVVQAETASRSDVERTQELVRQVSRIEQDAAANVEEHRTANDAAHREICRLIIDVARAAGLDPKPCDFPAPHSPP